MPTVVPLRRDDSDTHETQRIRIDELLTQDAELRLHEHISTTQDEHAALATHLSRLVVAVWPLAAIGLTTVADALALLRWRS